MPAMDTVFITGATGVLGNQLVPLFLAEPNTRVVLLIRADSDSHAKDRLHALASFWQLDIGRPLAEGKLRTLQGDAWQPRMGLSESDFTALAGEVTHIVDVAGNVKFNQPRDEAIAHAMQAVRNTVELARQARHSPKLDWVSTVGVTGRLPGILREEPVTGSREFHNTYEEAKAQAEDFLLSEMKAGLPATVHRPSMVVGDSITGRITSFQVFYHICEFLSGRRTFGYVTQTGGHKLDLVPVDYVARAIHQATRQPATAGRIFNLCSGPDRSVALSTLGKEIRRLMQARGIPIPRLREIPPKWIMTGAPAIARMLPGRTGRTIASLPIFLTYLNESQGFDNTHTHAYFEGLGLTLPLPNDYLTIVMDKYLADKYAAVSSSPTPAP